MVTGLPRTILLTSTEIRAALEEPVSQIVSAVKDTLDRTPPELAGDIMDRGITLAGGGALLQRHGRADADRVPDARPAHRVAAHLRRGRVGPLARGVRGDPPDEQELEPAAPSGRRRRLGRRVPQAGPQAPGGPGGADRGLAGAALDQLQRGRQRAAAARSSAGISAVLSPVEEGASRALKPARDLVNWFDETFDARGENEDAAATRSPSFARRSPTRRRRWARTSSSASCFELDQPDAALAAYKRVTGRVIGRSPTVWYSDGHDRRRLERGRGGQRPGDQRRRARRPHHARRPAAAPQVTLITDHRSAVSARLLPDGPDGIVEPEVGDPEDLLLDFIANDEEVKEGQILVTAGWSNGRISSAYPARARDRPGDRGQRRASRRPSSRSTSSPSPTCATSTSSRC